MSTRSCPFCGKPVGPTLNSCPFCREAIPEAQKLRTSYTEQGRKYMRRGLLYTLMAGVIYYFAGGYSGMNLPIPIPPAVNQYLTPLLFAAGLGLVLYGLFLYMRG
jgi:hypothetical protein